MTQDERNTHLLPLVVGMIGTKGDIALLQRRAFLCADYAVRKVAPIGLDAAGLKEQAQTLRDLSPVVDGALAKSAAAAAAEAAAALAADAACVEDVDLLKIAQVVCPNYQIEYVEKA
jgi:hypothetical protein